MRKPLKYTLSITAIVFLLGFIFLRYPNHLIDVLADRVMVEEHSGGGFGTPIRKTVWSNGFVVIERDYETWAPWPTTSITKTSRPEIQTLQTHIQQIDMNTFSQNVPRLGNEPIGCFDDVPLDAPIPTFQLYQDNQIVSISGNEVSCNYTDPRIEFLAAFPNND